MTTEQIIEKLADFMGWQMNYYHGVPSGWIDKETKKTVYTVDEWRPDLDWNHWRQVELEMMDTGWRGSVRSEFLGQFENIAHYIEADLPTRCKALLAALDSQ
jgi:hypothetical protein